MVLPETGPGEARQTADRIRWAVDRYSRLSTRAVVRGIGASVGVASYPEDAADPETLLEKADQAMYADKRSRKLRKQAA